MRELTPAELEFISGGLSPDEEDIVVTGVAGVQVDFTDVFFYEISTPVYAPSTGGSAAPTAPAPTAQSLLAAHGSQQAVNNSSNQTAAATKAINDFKAQFLADMQQAMARGTPITLPDGSTLTQSQAEDFLSRLQFEFVDQNFGIGRAGANTISSVDNLIHVQININDVLAYDADPGGISYLIGHEIGHDTQGGISESSAMWQQYLQEPGVSSMTHDQQVANYPNSTEFKTNEQWANSAAQDITNALGVSDLSNPTYGLYVPPAPAPAPAPSGTGGTGTGTGTGGTGTGGTGTGGTGTHQSSL